jgi:hypothetical protein
VVESEGAREDATDGVAGIERCVGILEHDLNSPELLASPLRQSSRQDFTSKIGDKIPLVILSNAMDEQIHHNVAKLGAPFHAVYTAEQAQAYKPRYQAFEYMFDQLGCGPQVGTAS